MRKIKKIIKNSCLSSFLLFLLVSCITVRRGVDNRFCVVYWRWCNCVRIVDGKNVYNVKLNDNKDVIKNGVLFYEKNGTDLFLTSISRSMVKISLKNREIEWIKKLATVPQDNLLVDDEYIYFNGIDNNFYILNRNDGGVYGVFFNGGVGKSGNVKKPYVYKNIVVTFFSNGDIFFIDRLHKKVIDVKNYRNNVAINNNLLTMDEVDIIDLNEMSNKIKKLKN